MRQTGGSALKLTFQLLKECEYIFHSDQVSSFNSLCSMWLCSSKRYTLQAGSSDDRKAWLEVMEGKEPTYSTLKVLECE